MSASDYIQTVLQVKKETPQACDDESAYNAALLTAKNLRVSINPPRGGKDYNDTLLRVVNIERKPSLSRS